MKLNPFKEQFNSEDLKEKMNQSKTKLTHHTHHSITDRIRDIVTSKEKRNKYVHRRQVYRSQMFK